VTSNVKLIPLAGAVPQPWRNGGGVTRELLAWPEARDWRVRISVADVERDGPFSPYPGVARWFAVLAGAGVELTIDGATRRVDGDGEPLSFSGAAATTCRLLDGPTRDLNLMLRNALGRMERIAGNSPWQPRSSACGVFTATAGRCRHDGGEIEIPAETLLWFEHAPAELVFDAAVRGRGAAGWWFAVTTKDVHS
jgi:hypothetical protein